MYLISLSTLVSLKYVEFLATFANSEPTKNTSWKLSSFKSSIIALCSFSDSSPDGVAHAGRIGVIGIHNDAVFASFNHLRAVVGGVVARQCLNYVVVIDFEIFADTDGSHHVFKVIVANQLSINFIAIPFN